jgi:hypothetical protein
MFQIELFMFGFLYSCTDNAIIDLISYSYILFSINKRIRLEKYGVK